MVVVVVLCLVWVGSCRGLGVWCWCVCLSFSLSFSGMRVVFCRLWCVSLLIVVEFVFVVVDKFVVDFFCEMNYLSSDGLVINLNNASVELKAFICDAPIRSALKDIVNHSGYHCCEMCSTKGSFHGNTVVFLNQTFPLRRDYTF